MESNDQELASHFVYCQAHVGPHAVGWCTVSNDNKIGLAATTEAEAREEVKAKKFPWHGHCDICYKWVANEPWLYGRDTPDGKPRRTCPEHEEGQDGRTQL